MRDYNHIHSSQPLRDLVATFPLVQRLKLSMRKQREWNGGPNRILDQSRSGRPPVELKLSLESFWVRSKWPAGDVSFKRFSKFKKSVSHGLQACIDRGKYSLFQLSMNHKRNRISLLGARSCLDHHFPWSACPTGATRSPCCRSCCKALLRSPSSSKN